MKVIKVVPIKKQGWSPYIRYRNTKDTIAPYWTATGVISTGLTKEDEDKLGELLRVDLNKNSTFWPEYKIIMTDKPKEFNLDLPEDELAYKFLLAHKRVANSPSEVTPYSDYLMSDEAKEAEIVNKKSSMKRKAVKLFDNLTVEQMRDILKLYPGFVRSETLSNEIVEARLFEKVETDPEKFIEHVEDNTLDTKIFIKDLTQANILRKNKTSYYYGEDLIGHDLVSAVSYIDNPENQGLKVSLKKLLETK